MTLVMVDVSGQQPKRKTEALPAPLLPAEQAWLVTLPSPPVAAGALDGQRVYIPLQEHGIVALERETGETAWTNDAETALPIALAANVAILLRTDEVLALDRATGDPVWRTPLRSNPIVAALSTGDLIVAVLENEDVVALHVADGSQAWSVKVKGVKPPMGLAADHDSVYLNVGAGGVAALSRTNGTVEWQRQLDGQLSTPAVGKDRLFVGSTSNAFYALDVRNGKREWMWGADMIGGDVIGAAADGDNIYYVGLDNLLRALSRNGNQRWKQPLTTRPNAPPMAFGGIVVVFGVSPAMTAFNAKTGSSLGSYIAPNAPGASVPPVLKGPPLIDPLLRPFRVAAVVITAEGRAIGLRPTGMMFREPPAVPLTVLPGKPLTRESSPLASPAK